MCEFLHLPSFFDLEEFEQEITRLYVMQAWKMDEYRGKTDLSDILESMEAKDKEALFQVQKFFPLSPVLRRLFDGKFLALAKELLESDIVLVHGPQLFINRPHTTRLLYSWHSEEHWFPKRRRLINVWFPVFKDKTAENGTMSVLLKSHEKQFPFVEYKSNEENAFTQYEIPEKFLTGLTEKVCLAKRGDLILFHKNLVHRSNMNQSRHYSFAAVARIWTPEDDLTIEGDLWAKPYQNGSGRRVA